MKKPQITSAKVLLASFAGTALAFMAIFIFYTLSDFSSLMAEHTYQSAIDVFKNDNTAINLAQLCNVGNDTEKKIHCVYDYFSNFYNYTTHPAGFKSPSQTINEGGVCRDSAIFYCSVFENMKIDCKIVSTKDHSYNIVSYDKGYCLIDQQFIACNQLA